MNIKEYNALKEKADELQRKADRATGALQEIMNDLAKEFECDSLEAAKRLQSKLEKKLAKLDQQYQAARKELEDELETR